ncbi:hypothetical protein FQN54_005363 [Arachnomyces sp. PD_36]|nr:hypothetical protein FQN54_005363 [Arachnomyces sp. PD_36]
MKFSIISLCALPLAAVAQLTATTLTVSWDPVYGNAGFDLLTSACSDGKNGLVHKGYKTAGDLPSFPNIGGAFSIGGWDSPNCGKCYSLEYEGVTIYVTAMDTGSDGFNLSEQAMNTLTNGRANEAGRIVANFAEAPQEKCFP